MLKQPVTQVRLTNVAVIRLRRGGKRFEVACFKNKVLNWRSGVEKDIQQVLQADHIFINVSKGEVAKTGDLKKVFGTTDVEEIAKIILDEGEVQVSEKERQVEAEKRLLDVCTFLTTRIFNKTTGLPFTSSAIESLLRQIGFSDNSQAVKPAGLKALQKLCEAYPEQVARTQMLLSVTIPIAKEAEFTKVVMDIKGSIKDKSAVSEDALIVQLYCDPMYYRTIQQLKWCQVHVQSNSECVMLNVSDAVTSESEREPKPQPLPEPRPDKPMPQSSPSTIKCRTCLCEVTDGENYRSHCKTAWHKTNVKRKLENLPILSEIEFTEEQLDDSLVLE